MADDMRRRRELAARAFIMRRKDLELTQEQVAQRAGIVVRTVSNFENGRWPNARTRALIEEAVGWPPGEINRQAGDGDGRTPELEPRFLARLRQLDPAERARLIEWLERQPPGEANGGRTAAGQ